MATRCVRNPGSAMTASHRRRSSTHRRIWKTASSSIRWPVIGAGVEIGAGTVIGAAAVIGAGVKIGRDCNVGAHCAIQAALIGNNVLIHPGCSIGQDGYGFVFFGPDGHLKVPQTGRVLIQNDVEVGAGTTIDRGSLRDTVIGEGTKIDNQVQIGHNVTIGRHCLLAAQIGLAGSLTIGDNVALGAKVGINNHLKIGDGTSTVGNRVDSCARIASSGSTAVTDNPAPAARRSAFPFPPRGRAPADLAGRRRHPPLDAVRGIIRPVVGVGGRGRPERPCTPGLQLLGSMPQRNPPIPLRLAIASLRTLVGVTDESLQTPTDDLPEQMRIRREKRARLLDTRARSVPGRTAADPHARRDPRRRIPICRRTPRPAMWSVSRAGSCSSAIPASCVSRRCWTGDGTQLQAMLSLDEVSARRRSRRGRPMSTSATTFLSAARSSRRGAAAVVLADAWQMAAKSLRPLPVAHKQIERGDAGSAALCRPDPAPGGAR